MFGRIDMGIRTTSNQASNGLMTVDLSRYRGSPRLRLHQLDIHLKNESRVGTPIRQNLLFVQEWPNLLWGRFNNVEVDSINTSQVTLL